jgi:hypothetical protein
MLIFAEEGKPEKNRFKGRERINNKLNSHMTPSPGANK